MALTPVEIRHIRLRKAFFGYQIKQTDDLLADIVNSFEDVWRDRADLADKIEQLGAELVRYRELEQLLRTTLISAERASQQMTDQTRRETESVLGEARAEAREILRNAMTERERLNAEITRVRAQLSAVLTTIGDDLPERSPARRSRLSRRRPLECPRLRLRRRRPLSLRPRSPSLRLLPRLNRRSPLRSRGPSEPTGGQAMAAAVANGIGWPVPR